MEFRRVNAYLAAGADLGFIEGPTSVEEVKRICREVKGPVFYNMTGVSPRFTMDDLRGLGVAVCISPNAMLRLGEFGEFEAAKARCEKHEGER